MTEIHHELKEALLEWRRLQKVASHFQGLTTRLRKETKEIKQLDNLLEKEEKDLKQLESVGIRSLFHKILGDKEKQIEIERQQYLQSALKYNALSKSIDLIEYERELLEKKLERFDAVEQRYEQLIKLREKELLRSDTAEGRKLLALSKKIDARHIELKDIDEAIVAGNKALKYIRILEQIPRPWSARRFGPEDPSRDHYDQQHVVVSKDTALGLKVQHGVVPVEKDGSAHFLVMYTLLRDNQGQILMDQIPHHHLLHNES